VPPFFFFWTNARTSTSPWRSRVIRAANFEFHWKYVAARLYVPPQSTRSNALDDERDRRRVVRYTGASFYVSYPRIVESRRSHPCVHGNYWAWNRCAAFVHCVVYSATKRKSGRERRSGRRWDGRSEQVEELDIMAGWRGRSSVTIVKVCPVKDSLASVNHTRKFLGPKTHVMISKSASLEWLSREW